MIYICSCDRARYTKFVFINQKFLSKFGRNYLLNKISGGKQRSSPNVNSSCGVGIILDQLLDSQAD